MLLLPSDHRRAALESEYRYEEPNVVDLMVETVVADAAASNAFRASRPQAIDRLRRLVGRRSGGQAGR